MFDHSKYPLLSERDKAIAIQIEYLSNDVPNMSIHELARKLFISSSTLSRFVHRIGFESYKQFKESYVSIPNPHETNVFEVFTYIYENNIEIISTTITPLIINAKTIYIICSYIGKFIGHELALQISACSINAINLEYSASTKGITSVCNDNDIFIIIEDGHLDDDTYSFASNIARCGTIILLTNKQSDLAKYASIILNIPPDIIGDDIYTSFPLHLLTAMISDSVSDKVYIQKKEV